MVSSKGMLYVFCNIILNAVSTAETGEKGHWIETDDNSVLL